MSTTTTIAPAPVIRTARPRRALVTPARVGIYAFLLVSSAFFLLPLYVMVVTSLKSSAEVRQAVLFAWPAVPQFGNWIEAWSSACIALACEGIQGGFWNSVRLVIPATVLSVFLR
jgi:glucose/mannose transport system permease protein